MPICELVSRTVKTVKMATSVKFEEFNGEDIDTYLERILQHFIALDIKNDNAADKNKRKAILLSSMGAETYRTLRDLCYPDAPATKEFDDLSALLKGYYTPKKLLVAERVKFRAAKQQTGESVTTYAARLRKLISTCGFVGDQIDDNLREQFISGLGMEATKRKLLSEELTFKQAYDRAIADEAAGANVKDLSQGVHAKFSSPRVPPQQRPRKAHFSPRYGSRKPDDGRRNHPPDDRRHNQPQRKSFGKCPRCGFTNHKADECKYKTAECFKCHKIGHLRSECKTGQWQHRPRNQTHFVGEEELVDSVFNIDSVNSDKTVAGSITVSMDVEDVAIEFMLDTGSPYTIISDDMFKKSFPQLKLTTTTRRLHAYSGKELEVLGETSVRVQYGDQHAVLTLVVVRGSGRFAPALLGRDWLTRIRLNWKAILTAKGLYSVSGSEAITRLEQLKTKYASIFESKLGSVQGHQAHLHVPENTKPIFVKARPVPFALRPAVESELERMEQEGIIYPVSFSDWATPLVCVPKSDGSVRLCGDYKVTVNRVLKTDQHPIPTPEEVLSKMAGGEKFTKLDLKSAYQQLLLDEESQQYVTINTHKGLYRYTRLPFGTSSSPAIWQRFIDQAIQGIDMVCAIQDDVIISGRNDDEHLRNLEEVFSRFQKLGLKLKLEKCAFFEDSVVFFALRVSKDGVQPTEDKVRAIKEAPTPTNVNELRSWLGMLNFHAKFLPNISTVLAPLHDLLGNRAWQWTSECDRAFQQAKDLLTSDRVLVHYDANLPLYLAVDASPYGLGAVILHEVQGHYKPVAYASRSLNPHEKGYSQLDKEAAAIMFGVQRFHMYLYGRHFVILTDHKPLERILGPKSAVPTLAAQRLQRWAITLAGFDYDLKYIPSKENCFADALSRLPLPETGSSENPVFMVEENWLNNLPVSSKDVKEATRKDPVLSKVLEYLRSGWPSSCEDIRLKPYFDKRYELSVVCDCIMWGLRVVVPATFHERILDELHCAHPGIVRMKEVARSHVWWPGIDSNIEQLVRSCSDCQRTKPLPGASPIKPWIWPNAPWVRIHVDFAEKDNNHFLLCVDAHSKWPEVVWMKSTTTKATIVELRKIFATYGIPQQLVSDNGPQFRSSEFADFLRQNGVKHILTSPYHPASNGQVERLVQSFKRSLTAIKEGDLHQKIASFLLTYRSTKHATTGVSPAMLFLGRELRTRLSLLTPQVEDNVRKKQAAMINKECGLREFYPGDYVVVKDMRKDDTWWPGTVAERSAPKSYVIVLTDGRVWRRHVDHMRRADVDILSHDHEEVNKEVYVPVDKVFPYQAPSVNSGAKSTDKDTVTTLPSQHVMSPCKPVSSPEKTVPSPVRTGSSPVKVRSENFEPRRSSRVHKTTRRLVEEM